MRAVCWEGKSDVQVHNVPDPKILNPRDAVLRITTTAICGSDLHLYDGYIPTMQKGDILGGKDAALLEDLPAGADAVHQHGAHRLADRDVAELHRRRIMPPGGP